MSANVDLNQRPDYDAVLQDIADYVLDYRIDSAEALDTARNCLMDTLGCGLLALRFPECTKHLGPLVEAPWSRTARGCRAPPSGSTRSRPPGTSAASSAGWTTTTPGWPPSGAILGQPRRHPRRRRPPLAETPGQRRSAAEHAPGTGSDDHGSRDPGRDRPGELVQSRRPRPCAAGQGRVHRRLRQADGGRPRATAGRPLPRLRRRPGPAHLPSRTERRLAQVLGRWRRDEPRRTPGGHRLARRDGHPRRAQRAAVGFLRCPVQPHQQGPGDQARTSGASASPRATAAT